MGEGRPFFLTQSIWVAFAVAVLSCGGLTLHILEKHEVEGVGTPRLERYCSHSVKPGSEGHPAQPDLELRGVVLLFRHGDRSPLPAALPGERLELAPNFTCEVTSPEASWATLERRFRVVNTQGVEIPNAFSGSAAQCLPGQLTEEGFRQHMDLGELLRQAYSSLLVGLQNHTGALYVRSTNYPRTITSAGALLTTLLPHWDGQIDIQVNLNQEEENMLGRGLSGPHVCPSAISNLSAQRTVIARSEEGQYTQLEHIFGNGVRGSPVMDFADVMLAANCHRLQMPCGPYGCADQQLATSVTQTVDRQFCMRYAGAGGGATGTQLSMFPLMKEILAHLQAAAVESSPKRLTVLSGHDTVVAPALSALGVFEGPLCSWPSYAARISLELYRQGGPPVRHLVRVLYDGEVLTGVRGCGSQNLCPLEDFAAGVQSLLGGSSSWKAACDV